jgi:ribosomal protein S18 acetylase RimI-like enzyme
MLFTDKMNKVREATGADIGALVEVRNTPDLYREYLAEAKEGRASFLVYERDGKILGFGRLKWPCPEDATSKRRPSLSDLHVATRFRSQGIGSALIRAREILASRLGHSRIYVGVDPVETPHVFDIFRRRGYVPLQEKPYQATMEFHPPDGGPSIQKTYQRIDLVQTLSW